MSNNQNGSFIDKLIDAIWSPDLRAEPRWRHTLLLSARIAHTIVREITEGTLTLHATGLVYTTLLSLVPLLALSFSVLKGFGVHNQIEPILLELLEPLGEQATEITERLINFVDNMRVGVLGTLGLAVLIYTVISMMQRIERAFNEVWHVARSRSLARRFSDFLSVILLGPVLLFTALGIGTTLTSNELVARASEIQPVGLAIETAVKLTPFLLIVAAFSFIYGFIPNTKVRIRSALLGGLIAGAMWVTAGWLFATFVSGSGNYQAIYSAFAAIIVFMIWLYVAWLILLTGASISFYVQHPEYLSISNTALKPSNRQREHLALAAILGIGRAFYQGQSPPTLEKLGQQLRAPSAVLDDILSSLEEASLISRTAQEPPGYLPGCPFETTPLKRVLEVVREANEGTRAAARRGSLDPAVTRIEDRISEAINTTLADQTLKDLVLGSGEDRADVANRHQERTAGPRSTA